MADENDKAPSVELDEEGKGLQLRAEKAKFLETITKSEQVVAQSKATSLTSLLPTVSDAPTGDVTLGEKAGSFGPWRAHRLVDEVAKEIANRVRAQLPPGSPRVLIVDDRSLLPDDWATHHVRSTLARLANRLKVLDGALRDGLTKLDERIAQCRAEEDGSEVTTPAPPATRRRGAQPTPAAAPIPAAASAPAAASTAAGPGNALGAAIELLGLLRTDYTITATAVSTTVTELSTLTAGHLAAGADDDGTTGALVELDAFTTMRPSPTMEALRGTLKARDDAVGCLLEVESRAAPIEAELESIKTRLASVEQAWQKATAEKKDETAIGELRSQADTLIKQQSRRQQAAGPARTLVVHAHQVIIDVDAAVSGFLKAPEGGTAPLVTAVRRERLDEKIDKDKISYVLYVHLDAVGADAVTRRSILGTSSRIRFLSAANASWLLLATSTGAIAAGGQVDQADLTTFGLDNGTTSCGPVSAQAGGVESQDRLDKLEESARLVVIGLVILLALVGILSLVAFVAAINAALS